VAGGILYVVATPIGHLGDLSSRALEILKSVDFIACEDTRHTRKLCQRFGIRTRLESFHDHSGDWKPQFILKELATGKSVALVSDSGTPLIADPGYPLVDRAQEAGVEVVPVPGPSALIAALCASGLPCERFIFEGFLPVKSGERKRRLGEIAEESRTVVYYESPYRLLKTLKDIEEVLPERILCVAKELTKQYEEIFRGTAVSVLKHLGDRAIKGEYVIVISGKGRKT